ncbi:MAG TPA: hypothetical protein VMV94_01635 [Phycisphaerae bacterium]|nr:hypothetical protein [Phycisphaerae bacterium]
MTTRPWLRWTLAVVIAAVSILYQRMTGPTHPVRGHVAVDGADVKFRLPRSHAGEGDAEIKIPVRDAAVHGTIEFCRFPTDDPLTRQGMERRGEDLVARIPHQPIAGKVKYRILLDKGGADPVALSDEPVIMRFKGNVPLVVLIPHILGIVAAMVLSVRAGLEALAKGSRTFTLAVWTTICLFLGGLFFGAIVQKCAFEAYWRGWPFGYDLTDNKTLIAFLFWLVAVWQTARNRTSSGWVIAASVIMLVIWLIPHSVLGSELDYARA